MIERIYGDAGIKLSLKNFYKVSKRLLLLFGMAKKLFHVFLPKIIKKVGNGNTGANTGGMGTVAPSPEFTAEHLADFNKIF